MKMALSKKMNVMLTLLVLLVFSVILASCMWMPAAQDDFSVLGNDHFSHVIKESLFDMTTSKTGLVGVGVNRIDPQKVARLSREFLLGKTRQEVFALFERNGGACKSQKTAVGTDDLICEVDRKWQLKNTGAPFDTNYWSDPAAKLVYAMDLSGNEAVIALEVRVIDITIYKPIKG